MSLDIEQVRNLFENFPPSDKRASSILRSIILDLYGQLGQLSEENKKLLTAARALVKKASEHESVLTAVVPLIVGSDVNVIGGEEVEEKGGNQAEVPQPDVMDNDDSRIAVRNAALASRFGGTPESAPDLSEVPAAGDDKPVKPSEPVIVFTPIGQKSPSVGSAVGLGAGVVATPAIPGNVPTVVVPSNGGVR